MGNTDEMVMERMTFAMRKMILALEALSSAVAALAAAPRQPQQIPPPRPYPGGRYGLQETTADLYPIGRHGIHDPLTEPIHRS